MEMGMDMNMNMNMDMDMGTDTGVDTGTIGVLYVCVEFVHFRHWLPINGV
jgi:hypothetical protein